MCIDYITVSDIKEFSQISSTLEVFNIQITGRYERALEEILNSPLFRGAGSVMFLCTSRALVQSTAKLLSDLRFDADDDDPVFIVEEFVGGQQRVPKPNANATVCTAALSRGLHVKARVIVNIGWAGAPMFIHALGRVNG